jgi:hypothetical protein
MQVVSSFDSVVEESTAIQWLKDFKLTRYHDLLGSIFYGR